MLSHSRKCTFTQYLTDKYRPVDLWHQVVDQVTICTNLLTWLPYSDWWTDMRPVHQCPKSSLKAIVHVHAAYNNFTRTKIYRRSAAICIPALEQLSIKNVQLAERDGRLCWFSAILQTLNIEELGERNIIFKIEHLTCRCTRYLIHVRFMIFTNMYQHSNIKSLPSVLYNKYNRHNPLYLTVTLQTCFCCWHVRIQALLWF